MADLNSKIITLYDVAPIATEIKKELEGATGPAGPEGQQGEPGKNVTVEVSDNDDGSHKIVFTYYENGDETFKTQELNIKDGRSIKNVYTDSNNNIFATFSDGKTQQVGTLDIDIQGDFLTQTGFGKLRYYLGKFQYYNEGSENWVDAVIDPQNPYILQMNPGAMQFIVGIYDNTSKHYKLKWLEPNDTIIEGQAAVIVEKVVIVRKQDSAPTSLTDGIIVVTIPRSEFGAHENSIYEDTSFQPDLNTTWFYKAFPVATTGFANMSSVNEVSIKAKDYHLFGFKVDQTESDPSHMVTYLPECDNYKFRSAYMNYNTDLFYYGDWTPDFGSWFMDVKPCLLKQDGTISKYLDLNDYEKDINGNDVSEDIKNESNNENVMIAIPKIYWEIVDNKDGTANIYFSDKKLKYKDGIVTDSEEGNFVCYSHLDENGDEIPYCYMSAYNGYYVTVGDDGIIRVLSDKEPLYRKTVEEEKKAAKANNIDESHIWNIELYCDRVLINLLLLLIGKSTDTQYIFGKGYCYGAKENSNSRINTGTMNKRGLFYGKQDGSYPNGVKVFGIENYWGNQWRTIDGYYFDHGSQKVKMTYHEGGYDNIQLYEEIPNSVPSSVNQGGIEIGYISTMIFSDKGLFPIKTDGSGSVYWADTLWYNTEISALASVGGGPGCEAKNGYVVGAFSQECFEVSWSTGSSLSCKPLASTFEN